jgi:hypothetical protein
MRRADMRMERFLAGELIERTARLSTWEAGPVGLSLVGRLG